MQEESALRDLSFEELLLEAIDEGLSSLGNSVKHMVYFYLKEMFKLDKLDIPHKIEEFVDSIERIFGLGSKFLEILIMKHIYEKVGQVFESSQEMEKLVFIEYVETAKQSFQKKIGHELVQCKQKR